MNKVNFKNEIKLLDAALNTIDSSFIMKICHQSTHSLTVFINNVKSALDMYHVTINDEINIYNLKDAAIFIALCNVYAPIAWKCSYSNFRDEKYFTAGIKTPKGQIVYNLKYSIYWNLLNVTEVETLPDDVDYCDNAEMIERFNSLTPSLSKPVKKTSTRTRKPKVESL